MRKRLQTPFNGKSLYGWLLFLLLGLPILTWGQCDYKIVGYDSWGDGWNGASIDVDVAGTVTNFTLSSGSVDSTTIPSFNGDLTTFTFNSGSFDSEVTFDIFAPDGSLLGSYGPNPSTGLFLTDVSNATCPPPCDYKIVGYDSWGDGWNGASIDVDVAGAVTNFTLSSGSIDSTTITSYNGDITTFTFNSGSFDSEVTFDIYAPDGTLLGSYGPSPSTGLFLTDTSNSTCTAPSCQAPVNLMVTSFGIDSASFSWSALGSAPANGYDYQIVPDGNGIGSGVVAAGNASSTSVSVNTGLSGGTSYDFYVRSNCSGTDTSSYAGPLSFTTLPDSASGVSCTGTNTATVLFSEEFDNNNAGWTGDINSSNGSWEIPDGASSSNTGADNAYSGSSYMNYEASSTSANSGSIVSPAIDLSAASDDAELSFWMHAYGASMGTLEIGVGTSSSGPFTTEFTWTGPLQTSGSDAWVNVGVDLSSYLGQTVYIQLTQHDTLNNLGSGFDGDMSIDLFEVSTCVGCAIPSGLTSTNITASAADLDWTENGSATSWEISYGTSGFTPGAGTQTVAGSKPFTLSGLSSGTTYDWYIRSICGPGDTSAYSSLGSFSTLCAPFIAPYTESFDANAVPNCWSSYDASGSGWEFGQNGSAGYAAGNASETTGNGGYYAWIDFSGTDDSTNLETFDVDVSALTTPSVAFDLFSYNTNDNSTNILYVEAWNGSNWVQADSIRGDLGGWAKQYVDLSSFTYGSSMVKVRFRGESGGSSGDFYNDLLIDEVTFDELPTCFPPSNLQTQAIGVTDATLSWVTGGSSNWQIQYDTAGFVPGSGNFVAAANDTFTLTGLSAQTTYDVYVRDSCGPGDVSPWDGPLTFTTACNPASLPYTMAFTGGTFPTCWNRSSTTDVSIEATCGNGINVLEFNYEEQATTIPFSASNLGQVKVSYDIGGGVCTNDPEDSEHFEVLYWDGMQWVMAKDYDGTIPQSLQRDSFYVAGSALTDNFQVRFDMIDGTTDAWHIDSVVVEQSCNTPVMAPVTESFDANANPGCWSSYEANGGGWEYGQNGSAGYAAGNANETTGNGGYYAWIDFSGTDDSTNLETYEVDVSALTTPGLMFDLFSYNTTDNSTNILYVEAWNGSSWVQADSIRGDLGGWAKQYVDLSSYTYSSNLVKVRFRGESGGSSGDFYNDLLIDEVTFDELPTCIPPSQLQVVGVTGNSATLTWTTGGASNWRVEYDTAGFTLGNGTLLTAANDTLTITGLSSQTNYDFYVQDSCGMADVSLFTGPTGFTTGCAAATLPYTMSFSNGNFPTCWSRTDASDVSIVGSCGSGSNVLEITYTNEVTTIGLDASSAPSVKVSYDIGGGVCTNDPEDSEHFEVQYWDGSQWVMAKDYDGSIPNVFQRDSFYVPASALSNYFRVRFDQIDGTSDAWQVDSVVIEAGPSCLPSTNLQQVSSSGSSATVTWDAGGSSNWIVEYGTTGFTPGSGTTLNASNDTITITGLSTGTIYDFYVTDSCGAGNLSTASGPGNFSTDACLASAQCAYTLNLYDSFGDGWNGNEVDVFQGGIPSGSFGSSFTSGDSLTGLSLDLCPNQTIDLILNEGSFSSEISFYVMDPVGDTVAQFVGTFGMATGDTLASFSTAPAANAGMSGNDSVCTNAGSVDLSSYLGSYDQGGTWTDLSATGALTDSLFNASAVGSGTYNFTYSVSSSNGCSTDSASVAITVNSLNNAGADSSITACSNAGALTLNNFVSTTGGSWVDLDNSGAFNAATSDFTPMASMGGSTFRFGYIVGGNLCPDDTAIVSVMVDVPANAGGMAADTLCDTAMVVDLNNYLDTTADAGGNWVDVNGSGGLTGSSFDPSMVTFNASYDFRYVVSAPCGADSTTVSLYVDHCSSGIEEYLNGQVNLFPNPAQDVVNIETTGTLTNMAVTVYDAQGKALIRSTLPTNGSKQLDVSALPAGMYTVSIQSDQGMAVKRFVKE